MVTTRSVLPTAVPWARVATALAPAGVYLAIRLTGLLVLAWMATQHDTSLVRELTSWDGAWLLAIAEHGYDGVPAHHVDAHGQRDPFTTLAFFPGYPLTVAVVARLVGGDVVIAGLLVSLVAGIAAAYGLTRIGELVPGGSRRVGLLLVALFAAAPPAYVLNMTYTEALFCALAAWALVAVLRRQWLSAGVLTAGAGLVRPTANALLVAVGLAAVVAAVTRREGWRPWVGTAVAASGLLGYLGYVAVRTGTMDGWFAIQRAGWGWHVDGGRSTLAAVGAALVNGQRIFDVVLVLSFAASLVLTALAVRARLPWPLLCYGAVVLATVWGSAGLTYAKVRLLLVAFVLLLPVAVALARVRTTTAVAVVAGAALASAWFGGYALTIWRYGI